MPAVSGPQSKTAIILDLGSDPGMNLSHERFICCDPRCVLCVWGEGGVDGSVDLSCLRCGDRIKFDYFISSNCMETVSFKG